MTQLRTSLRFLAALAVAGMHAALPAWEPSCDETRDDRYQFEHLGGSKADPVTVELCRDAACTNKSAFATVTEHSYAAPRPAGPATYFLVAHRGTRRTIAARRLVLEGAYKFRDLGGFATKDGKRTRWGQVFAATIWPL